LKVYIEVLIKWVGWLLVFVFVINQTAYAQTEDPVHIIRINQPITLDGSSDEPAWQNVDPLPMTMYQPTFGGSPSEKTEVRVAYDDTYMYFSMRAYDSNPDGIRGNILFRDRFGSDDYFEVMIDTFNDNENSLVFTTNPAGIRRDVAITQDGVGEAGSWVNADYNTFWDVGVEVTDKGWFAETRVPLSSLRFQDKDGRVEMGLSLHRIIVRKSERAVYPAIEPSTDFAYLKPSRMQTIVLEGVESQRPVYVRPYVLGGLERAAVSQESSDGYRHIHDQTADLGLDVKYGLTSNLTMDLTLNTDFAQVEVDDQQVNLTRFSLFFPEKRQFFQERAGLFEFRTGGLSRLFHSRRIGLTDDGEMVRILGGARIVGRAGDWDVGFVNMQTEKMGDLPSENFGALRLKRQIFNPYSYAGGMMTSRIGADGNYNLAYGVDGTFRLYGDDYLTVRWAHTLDEREQFDADWSPGKSGRFFGVFEKRLRDGFGYRTGVIWSGEDYSPQLGFVQRSDFTQLSQDFSYSWRPGDDSSLIYHTFLIGGESFIRNIDGTVETFEAGPEWSFLLKKGGQGSIGANLVYEDLLVPFTLDQDAYIPAGGYTFYRGVIDYTMSRSGLFRLGTNLEAGGFYDGYSFSISLQPTWNISPHLELQGTYGFDHVEFPNRNQTFNSHLARLRVGVPFNTEVSTNIFLQYNSTIDSFSTNARFRYNFSEGHDLWIVYNENMNTNLNRLGQMLPRNQYRSVMVKYTYTFIL
jgi:hypothetical protein